MKVGKKKILAIRHYHISLLVFLVALGLVPASFISNANAENTERVTERATTVVDNPEIKTENIIPEIEIAEISEDYLADYDRIEIAGNTVPIFYSSSTLIDAGSQVGLYGGHFLYGHNTANVFGGLSQMGIGDYFTVTLGGETKTYQVVNQDLQAKSHFEGEVIRQTTVSNMRVLTSMKIMKAITAYGEYNGNYYDYILMTCAGTSYGNGDASHRLILMANEV